MMGRERERERERDVFLKCSSWITLWVSTAREVGRRFKFSNTVKMQKLIFLRWTICSGLTSFFDHPRSEFQVINITLVLLDGAT